MATLMGLSLPAATSRLRINVLTTAGKEQAAESNRNPLDEFICENCFEVAGEKVLFKDFYNHFMETLTAFEQASWTKRKVRQNVPDSFPVGINTGGQLYVGNVSFTDIKTDPDAKGYVAKGKRLSLEE